MRYESCFGCCIVCIQLLLTVGTKDAHEHLKRIYDIVKDDVRISSLGIDALLTTAKDSHQALVDVIATVDAWAPDNWEANKTDAEAKMVDSKKKFPGLLDFKHTLDTCHGDRRSKQLSTQRTDMHERGTPEDFANYIAACVQPRKDSRVTSYLVRSYGSSSGPKDEFTHNHDWREPCGFVQDAVSLFTHTGEQHWHQTLKNGFTNFDVAAQEKVVKAVTFFGENKKESHVCSTLGPYAFPWNEKLKEHEVMFKNPQVLDPYIICQKSLYFCSKLIVAPTQGVPCFLTCLVGVCGSRWWRYAWL